MTQSKCFHCNGYYGPSFGQPVCATCHMFLYPDDSALHSSSFHFHDLKVEDGDSGNEEPGNEEPREPSDCNAPSDTQGLAEASGGSGGLSLALEDEGESPPIPVDPPSGLSGVLPHFNMLEQVKEGVSNLVGTSEVVREVRGPLDPPLPERGRSPTVLRFDIPHNWGELPQGQEDLSPSSTPSESQLGSIHSIPPEVLLVVFQHLDEVSLWSVGQVCRRWSQLVHSCTLQWRVFLQRRWPLFAAIYTVTDWHKVFTNLIESAPCQLCLFRMPYNTVSPSHEDSWRRKRLSNERRTLQSDPPEGIHAAPLDHLSLHWQASIRGPAGSPYQGGTFFLYIQIPSNYPLSPPLVQFTSRVFHPNVSRHGDIGIDSIHHNWSVAITISKVLVSIQSLFTDPYTKVCMEPRIGEMYEGNRVQFDRIARAWTWCYAMHDAIDPDSRRPGYLGYLASLTATQGPDEEENPPDDGRRSPDDGQISPDDSRSSPDDGRSSPDDGRSSPDDGRSSPDDGRNSPDDCSLPRDDAQHSRNDARLQICKEEAVEAGS